MSRPVHQPIRSCLGCGQRDFQASLLRIVLAENGQLRKDQARRLPGRGGYLHLRPQCWEDFAARKGPVRSFRTTVDRPTRVALATELRRTIGL